LIYAGYDLGVAAAKVAIIDDKGNFAFDILSYKSPTPQAAVDAMAKVLAKVGLSDRKIDRCLSTGLGGKAVPYSDGVVPDAICLSRAVREFNPRVRTVINIGGQSTTAFNTDGKGGVVESAVTDICVAGMGMFIEVIANALEMPLDELIRASLGSKNPLPIASQCVVFAESEVISLINEGCDKFDIFAGVASAVAAKIAGLVRRVDVIEEVAMVGGVAKNGIVVRDLEEKLGLRFASLNGVDPRVLGACGAALVAREGCDLRSETISMILAERFHGRGKQ
jgi:predicted CoA-substrate-specific enzyme activase